MANSNTDKKIGRKKAGTWGRTSGGYSPAAAKQSKRAGSKGARKVAKDDLRNIREYGEHEAKITIEKKKLRKKLEKVAPWMAKGIKDSYPKPVKEEKMSGQEYSSYMKKVKSKDPEVKKAVGQVLDKKFVKQKGPATSRYHAKVSGDPEVKKAQKHMGEWTDVAGHGEDPNDATPPPKLTSSEKKKLAARTKKFKDMKAGEFAKAHGNQWRKMAKKEAIEYLDIPEGYIGRLADGNKKLMQKDSEKHDTGGFRISDADAKKAKARLKKKYGKFARHFREFNDLQELSPETLTRYVSKKLSKTAIKDLDSKDHKGIARAGRSMTKQTGTPIKDKSGKVVGKVHKEELEGGVVTTGRGSAREVKLAKAKRLGMIKKAAEKIKLNPKTATRQQIRQADIKGEIGTEGKLREQQRVMESLSALTSRGLGHKPIQKKKSKIDPGKAARKATAERLQKVAKARIRGTTSRQKFSEAYPVYKTKEYMDRPSREQRHGSYKQKLANKKIARSIHKFRNKDADKRKKVTDTKITNMHDVKDTMWGKGKHSTKKPYMEGTFTQQFDPEYTEGKQRIKNAIRKKLGLKPGPQADWKKELSKKHARQAMIKSFKKEEVKFPKDYDPPKSWSKRPSGKELDQMAKHYSKKKKIKEDAASGRPIKKPVKKINKKDSGKDGSFVFSSPKSNVIGSYELRNKIGARLGLKPITAKTGVSETAEYKAAMGPGSHEWGTDIGRDYFKKLTPGQDNPPEDPIKPLNIKARKPQDEKGVKVTETKLPPHLAKFINPKTGNLKAKYEKRISTGKKPTFTVKDVTPKGYGPVGEEFSLDHIVAKQAEYSKEKYPEDNEVNARWQSNVDGILTGAYEGGKITWEDVLALDHEAETITFDQEVDMGLYDDDELEANDFDGDPLNDTAILEVLSVTGRMKRRFSARRNRQKLKVARAIALRRGSTPDRIKRRATRGARLMVYKRILRGRSRANLPPAEKARLERMITRFQPLVSRIAVKLMPQIRKNEIKRMGNRGKRTATVSKKFKAAKPIRGAASQKAKRYKIKKPGKYKAPKAKRYKMRGASGGPTIKRASKAYKAFSYSVG